MSDCARETMCEEPSPLTLSDVQKALAEAQDEINRTLGRVSARVNCDISVEVIEIEKYSAYGQKRTPTAIILLSAVVKP